MEFAAKRAEEAAAALREQERIAGEIEYQRALNHVNRIREEERLAAEAERYQQQLLQKKLKNKLRKWKEQPKRILNLSLKILFKIFPKPLKPQKILSMKPQ